MAPHQESSKAGWCERFLFVPEEKHREVICVAQGPPASLELMTFGASAWFPASWVAWATCAFLLTDDALGKASCTKATFSAWEVWLQLSVSSLRHSNCVISSVPHLGAPPKEFPSQARVPAITSASCPVYDAVWWWWREVTKWHGEHLDVRRRGGEVPFWIRKKTIFHGVFFELFSGLCHEGLRQHLRTWTLFFRDQPLPV